MKEIPFGIYQSIQTMQENSHSDLIKLLKQRMLEEDENKDSKAKEIANYLNKPDIHTSHGKGINIDTASEKGLNVSNLHDDKKLEDLVLTVYHICSRLFETTPIQKIIMNHKSARYVLNYTHS